MVSMQQSSTILMKYLNDKNLPYQRVFLARSDPAMNYGLISAVLLNKIALQHLHEVQEETSIPIYPILVVGSAPFRGNLRPDTVEQVCAEYPSVHTFTIQSAFKYDHPFEEVQDGIKLLEQRQVSRPGQVDEGRCHEIIEKYTRRYIEELMPLSDIINRISTYIPSRRKRKLHIGLFGYSRSTGGMRLPRAITFSATLYSLGVPPEVLGLSALDDEDLSFIRDVYVNFDSDLAEAVRFANYHSPYLTEDMKTAIQRIGDFAPDSRHEQITNDIISSLKRNTFQNLQSDIIRAAEVRKFLG
jgi:phosphoenolpyruvate carboxylase